MSIVSRGEGGDNSYTAARFSFFISLFETRCIFANGSLSLSERVIEMSILFPLLRASSLPNRDSETSWRYAPPRANLHLRSPTDIPSHSLIFLRKSLTRLFSLTLRSFVSILFKTPSESGTGTDFRVGQPYRPIFRLKHCTYPVSRTRSKSICWVYTVSGSLEHWFLFFMAESFANNFGRVGDEKANLHGRSGRRGDGVFLSSDGIARAASYNLAYRCSHRSKRRSFAGSVRHHHASRNRPNPDYHHECSRTIHVLPTRAWNVECNHQRQRFCRPDQGRDPSGQQASTIPFKMSVQALAQTVNVSAETETLNTTDASLGNAISNRTIQSLPMEDRNVPDLLSLQPGVLYLGHAIDPESDSRTGTVNGVRSDQDNITMDGLDDNDQPTASHLPACFVKLWTPLTSFASPPDGELRSGPCGRRADQPGHKERYRPIPRRCV